MGPNLCSVNFGSSWPLRARICTYIAHSKPENVRIDVKFNTERNRENNRIVKLSGLVCQHWNSWSNWSCVQFEQDLFCITVGTGFRIIITINIIIYHITLIVWNMLLFTILILNTEQIQLTIMKTCPFKYIENFTTKEWKTSNKKILIIFHISWCIPLQTPVLLYKSEV